MILRRRVCSWRVEGVVRYAGDISGYSLNVSTPVIPNPLIAERSHCEVSAGIWKPDLAWASCACRKYYDELNLNSISTSELLINTLITCLNPEIRAEAGVEDEDQRDVILLIVQNKIHLSLGSAFQDLFGNIAEAVWGVDFERRRPQGKFGDQKCDGYKVSEKCVFQCYGPRDLVASKMKNKIIEDFEGALVHFGANMQKWAFVHNDFEAPPMEAHNAIIELRSKNPDVKIEMWGPNQLMGMAINAPITALKTIVPVFPMPKAIRHLLFADLDAIVSHIDGIEPNSELTITVPSREKLEHNELSDCIEGMLRHGQIAAARIEEYFRETTRAEKGEKIAELFRREYRECKTKGWHPDSIFHRLIDLAGGLARPQNQMAVVIGLVAYFFHSCDIFENPATENSVA